MRFRGGFLIANKTVETTPQEVIFSQSQNKTAPVASWGREVLGQSAELPGAIVAMKAPPSRSRRSCGTGADTGCGTRILRLKNYRSGCAAGQGRVVHGLDRNAAGRLGHLPSRDQVVVELSYL